MAETGATEHGAMTHATKEGSARHFCAFVGVLDRGLADRDRNHIADDHHQSNFGCPGHGCRGDGQKGQEHAVNRRRLIFSVYTALAQLS